MVFRVLNRGVGRRRLFDDDEDYAAFERCLAFALGRGARGGPAGRPADGRPREPGRAADGCLASDVGWRLDGVRQRAPDRRRARRAAGVGGQGPAVRHRRLAALDRRAAGPEVNRAVNGPAAETKVAHMKSVPIPLLAPQTTLEGVRSKRNKLVFREPPMSGNLLKLSLFTLAIATSHGCDDRENDLSTIKPESATTVPSFITAPASAATHPMAIRIDNGPAAQARLDAFVKYCRVNGLRLVTGGDLDWNQWRVEGTNDHTYSVDFVFKVFPVNTSAASMEEALLFTSIRFPLVSEGAGFAVSDPTEHGRGPLGRSPEAVQASKNAREKMKALLKSYKALN